MITDPGQCGHRTGMTGPNVAGGGGGEREENTASQIFWLHLEISTFW